MAYGRERTGIAAEHRACVPSLVQRIGGGGLIVDAEALVPNEAGETFDLLSRAVRESIGSGRLAEGLDCLHTFRTKHMRVLCEKQGLTIDREKPLHSLVDEYLKHLRAAGKIKSEMAERITKSSISSLESFSAVRNDQSLAHVNEILASHEALYIFNHVARLVRFLEVLEETPPGGTKIQTSTRLPWTR